MADVFLSYAHQDLDRVAPLVRVLEANGWSVWWDRTIQPGASFRKVIFTAMAEASCVVVCWTRNSVHTDWVLDEADEGQSRNILVPVLLDDVQPPLGFRATQFANLNSWQAEDDNEEFRRFLNAVSECLARSGNSPPPPRSSGEPATAHSTKTQKSRFAASIALAVPAIIALAFIASPFLFPPPPLSVAVLRMDDLSSTTGRSEWADSLTRELHNKLGEVARKSELQVIDLTTALRFSDRGSDSASIGRELGVARIITGTVIRLGSRVRVTVEVTDVETRFQDWSGVFNGTVQDGFGTEIAIAAEAAIGITETLASDGLTPTLQIRNPIAESTEPDDLQQLFGSPANGFPTFEQMPSVDLDPTKPTEGEYQEVSQ